MSAAGYKEEAAVILRLCVLEAQEALATSSFTVPWGSDFVPPQQLLEQHHALGRSETLRYYALCKYLLSGQRDEDLYIESVVAEAHYLDTLPVEGARQVLYRYLMNAAENRDYGSCIIRNQQFSRAPSNLRFDFRRPSNSIIVLCHFKLGDVSLGLAAEDHLTRWKNHSMRWGETVPYYVPWWEAFTWAYLWSTNVGGLEHLEDILKVFRGGW